jgi:hypothetical protein
LGINKSELPLVGISDCVVLGAKEGSRCRHR